MTLTELSKKHNLDHDSAMAFLREWSDAQDSYIVQKRKHQNVCSVYSAKVRKGDMLIARPTLGE